MKIDPASALRHHLQPIAPVHGTCRPIEQPFSQGTQVQSGAAGKNRNFTAVADLIEHFARVTLIITSRENLGGLPDVDHMMRYALLIFGGRFGGSDVEPSENLDRIVV